MCLLETNDIIISSFIAVFLSFGISVITGKYFIKLMRSRQKYGQPIRDDGPESHKLKEGTPSMGGIMIIYSIIFTNLLCANLFNPYIWICIISLLGFGAIGFLDDYSKIKHNNYRGIKARTKLFLQCVLSILAIISIQYLNNYELTQLSLPFFMQSTIDIGILYVFFSIFLIVGSSNAVNLTDGLDGLAIFPIMICAICFALISYFNLNIIKFPTAHLFHSNSISEVTIFCASIFGAGLGFLWFNSQKAEIFMGDTGSLALGAVLGILAIMTKSELTWAIMGGIFVIEALSVIIQVTYFKKSGGKRIFRMAPIHHHFEKAGMDESKIILRFWIISILFALIALMSIY
jgi:phospho-N-acetylmuramoyl-pentapeptide-transferase